MLSITDKEWCTLYTTKVHFISKWKCMWLVCMTMDHMSSKDVLYLQTLARAPVLAGLCWRWICDICSSVWGHHSYINAGFHLPNQGFMLSEKSQQPISNYFRIIFKWHPKKELHPVSSGWASEVERGHFVVIFHTVSNLPHHGCNSLNCCEQTCFNYEPAQVNLIHPSLIYYCILYHWALRSAMPVTTTVMVVIYIFCS